MNGKLLLATLALTLSTGLHAAGDEHHHHHAHSHGEAAPTQLQLNAGKQWATDATLRQSMNEINQAMGKALPLIHGTRFNDGDYQALATTVSQKVAYAVENCKLDARADAMLHLVIADLLAGAEAMEGKAGKPRHDGAVQVMQALKSYGKYFRHPGWKVAQG